MKVDAVCKEGNFSARQWEKGTGALPVTAHAEQRSLQEREQRAETWMLGDSVSSFSCKTGILCLRRRLGDFRAIPQNVSDFLYITRPTWSKDKQNPFTETFFWRECICQLKCMVLPTVREWNFTVGTWREHWTVPVYLKLHTLWKQAAENPIMALTGFVCGRSGLKCQCFTQM